MQTGHRKVFATVRTEGALLPADLLARIVEGDMTLQGLTPEDYHLLPGERINEATNRAWNRAVGAWAAFQSARAQWSSQDAGTSETRERWLLPFFQELGYGRLTAARAVEVQGKSYPVSHLWGHVPIHLVGAGIDLDRRTAGVAGAARSSPHGLVQELLSSSDEHRWGVVANGLQLRILRDSARLSRPAYVEFDLDAMMEGEVYADFVLLWLLCHESRVEAARPEDCWLERWVQVAREQGTRVRDDLRSGVEQAIVALGRGFLAHPANGTLRERLRAGQLDVNAYYHELLRMVYRLLFLFVAEDREVLLDPGAAPEAQARYRDYYSTRRLRHLASRQRGSRHGDLYTMLCLVLRALGDDHGAPGLALPALGSFLFATGSASATPSIDACAMANHDLLDAVRALAFVVDGSVRRPVDFKNLGAEELGSVYEALLELHPDVSVDTGLFTLKTARGHERKTTGSYYTPESLTAELVKSAVDPVLDAAVAKVDAEPAILSLKICDPAAGSGHFLLAAARRLAKRLAQVRTGDAEPAPTALRTALRDVISRCIYAVDVNPMAVELCKVSLWLEAVEPGKPLNFLDHHIKCGNSLIGATRELLAKGIPDEAFDPQTGDDRAAARELKRLNKKQRESAAKHHAYQPLLHSDSTTLAALGADFQRLGQMRQDLPNDVRALSQRYAELQHRVMIDKLCADAWCSAFFWPVDQHAYGLAPTTGDVIELGTATNHLSRHRVEMIGKLAQEHRFFHWQLAFPDVFDGGQDEGFDCVLGNPPWERIKLQQEEFFAQRAPQIADAPNAAARKKLIAALPETDPTLHASFVEALHAAEAQSKFFRASKRYPLTARGDVNVYSIFAECGGTLLKSRGRMGMVLPWGIAVDDSNRLFFGSMVQQSRLVSAHLYANERKLFADTHHFFRFALFTFGGVAAHIPESDFITHVWRVEDVLDTERHFTLTPADFALINPNTGTLPIFRSRRDAEVTRSIYRAAPVLVDESGSAPVSPWGISFMRMFDMSNDSYSFRTRMHLEGEGYTLAADGMFRSQGRDDYAPLYEAKLFHQYNHRFATFESGPSEDKARDTTETELCDPVNVPMPRYWVPQLELEQRLKHWGRQWMVLYRRITNSTNERSFIAAALPRGGAGDPAPMLVLPEQHIRISLALLSNINALVSDFAARQKIGGMHLDFYLLKQLPILSPEIYARPIDNESLAGWITQRALELTYTSWNVQPLARDLGYNGPPFRWDEERRAVVRGELDGMFAHLYGLSREDFEYILTTFPVLQKNEERKYGEYRTARLALAAYDALAPVLATAQLPARV